MLLARSDISSGNSLSVPHLMAVRCHYPVLLLTSLPFLKCELKVTQASEQVSSTSLAVTSCYTLAM